MNTINTLVQEVKQARKSFIAEVDRLEFKQVNFKPTAESWSICEVVEHIVWAERAGVVGMWKATEGIKNNHPIWGGEPVHDGLHIKDVIAKTWKQKENVPDVARPRWGGSIHFWIASLEACQEVLEKLGKELDDLNPEKIIYPHPISGPLNIIQRLQFLAFHMERHQKQIQEIKNSFLQA